MNHALWIAKKNEICNLIKKISDHYGGDDIEWLREYAKEVIAENRDDIQKALDCFWDLEAQLKYMPKVIKNLPNG
jgi:hypothetical protein